MIDQPVAEIAAFLRRDQLPQCHLHLLRILDAVHQSHAVYQTDTVSVRHNSRLMKDVTHDQVGTLSAHARQCQQRIKILRYFSAVFFPQDLHAGTDISGLTFAQSTRPHNFFNIIYICFCQGSHIRIFLIKSFHHHVHSGIRALGCQPYTYQQLPRIVIIQCTVRIWIRFLQSVDDLKGQFFFFIFFHTI